MKNAFKLTTFIAATAYCFTSSLAAAAANPVIQELQFQAKNSPKGATLKLLVLDDVEGALVEVKGSYNVYDPNDGSKLATAFSASSYFMHPTNDGLKWGEEYPGVYQLAIVPDSPTSSILVHGIEYKGVVYAYQIDGAISFVNEVSIDDYAASMVSDRCQGKELSKEAFAALLIAARTDALQKSRQGKSRYWHVKATDVRYQGFAVCRQDKVFLEALKETSQMVMSSTQSIAWFNGQTPVEEIQKKAAAGKDARSILAETGKSSIVIAGK